MLHGETSVLVATTRAALAASGVQTGADLGTGITPGCDAGQPVSAETLRDPLVEVVGLDPTEAVALVHADGQVDLLVRSDITATRSSEVEVYLADHPPDKSAHFSVCRAGKVREPEMWSQS